MNSYHLLHDGVLGEKGRLAMRYWLVGTLDNCGISSEPISANGERVTVSPETKFVGGDRSPAAAQSSLARVPYFYELKNMIDRNSCQNRLDGSRVLIQQVLVQDQGDNLTCGYHAFKNACALAGLICGRSDGSLLVNRVSCDFFGDDGRRGAVRQAIIERRCIQECMNGIIVGLMKPNPVVVAEDNQGELRTTYEAALSQLIENRINQRCGQNQMNNIVIDVTQLRQALATAQAPTQSVQFVSRARRPDVYERYVNIPVNNFKVILPPESNGDNLNSTEIEFVRRSCGRISSCAHLINNLVDVPLQVIESTHLQPHAQGVVVEHPLSIVTITRDLQRNIANNSLPAQRVFAFILGSAPQCKGSCGHWIAMTVEIANGERRYTIADSLNELQIFNGPAADMIKFLEGEQFELVPSAQYLNAITTRLKVCLEQWEANRSDQASQTVLDDVLWKFEHVPHVDYSQFGGKEALRERTRGLQKRHLPIIEKRDVSHGGADGSRDAALCLAATAEVASGLPEYLVKFSTRFVKLSPDQQNTLLESLQLIKQKESEKSQTQGSAGLKASTPSNVSETKGTEQKQLPSSVLATKPEAQQTPLVPATQQTTTSQGPTPQTAQPQIVYVPVPMAAAPQREHSIALPRKKTWGEWYRIISSEIQFAGSTVQGATYVVGAGFLIGCGIYELLGQKVANFLLKRH